MDYLTWVKIIAMAVRLMHEPAFEKEFRVHLSWSSIDKLYLGSRLNTSVLNIDIYRAGSQEKVKTYVFIPWEDYYDKLEQIDEMFIPAMLNIIYTVTPYAIVYEVGGNPIAATGKEDILGIFESWIWNLLGVEYCNTVTGKNDGITLPGQLQVMTLTERRYFVEINAAIPGSKPVNHDEIRETFPGKMIYLVMTPDMGNSQKQWIKGKEPDFRPYFEKVKNELATILPDTVKKYETELLMDPEKKKKPAKNEESPANEKKSKQDSKKLDMKDKQGKQDKEESRPEDDSKADEAADIPPEDTAFPLDEPFGDYSPKEIPDLVLDYMPSLSEEIARLPEPVLKNLPDYISLFNKYQEEAGRKPGEWVDGNMILGAKPREYYPSEAELMLGETGERIRLIYSENSIEEIRKVLDEQELKAKQIMYRKYSFIHYDVMGSGRFFYVEDMEEVKLNLWEKE